MGCCQEELLLLAELLLVLGEGLEAFELGQAGTDAQGDLRARLIMPNEGCPGWPEGQGSTSGGAAPCPILPPQLIDFPSPVNSGQAGADAGCRRGTSSSDSSIVCLRCSSS